MSAFMVDKEHVDLMVQVAIRGPRGRVVQPGYWYAPYVGEGQQMHSIRHEDADWVGQMLVSENLRSIAARYPDTLEGGDIPGPVNEYYVLPYIYREPRYRMTAIEAIKAIHCYEYQACEHDGWRDSAAHDFCRRLESALTSCLDGYDEAPWSWTPEHITERMAVAR